MKLRKSTIYLPIVPARTKAILEVVKSLIVPHDDLPSDYLGDKLDGVVAVAADPQILHDPESCPRRCVQQPVGYSQPLAVVHERFLLRLLLYVVQHVPCLRDVPRRPHLLVQFPHLLVRRPPLRVHVRLVRPPLGRLLPPEHFVEQLEGVPTPAQLHVHRGNVVEQ